MKANKIKPEHQELMKEIGKRVKKLRSEKKIGYIPMSKEIGLSRNAYNSIELGNVYWNISSLLLIADYHKVSLSTFFMDL
jgi:DNA-binding XRE family transcriptional regulator